MPISSTLRLVTLLLGFGLCAASALAAGVDITRPGDPIIIVNGFNLADANAGPPPAAEGVEHAIDDRGQKYLNFLDLSSGFIVTPSGNPSHLPVTGLRLYTANDAEARDPASYQLFGSNDGVSWAAIAAGNLALPDGRNANFISIPVSGTPSAFFQEVSFANTTPYERYQLIFPTLKDAQTANGMQIAEVEILIAVPEPSSYALLLAGLIAMVGLARVRRSVPTTLPTLPA